MTTLAPSLPRPMAAPPTPRMALPLALALLCALAGRLSLGLRPFDHDSAMYVFSGKLVAQGFRLSDVLCDNKFPWTALAMSFFWRLFGTCWPAYLLLQIALGLLGPLILARAARRCAGPMAFWPTLLFGLVYMNFSSALPGGFELETIQAFLCIIAASSACDALSGRRLAPAFVAGLAAGCAALFKPTALALPAAFALAAVLPLPRQARPGTLMALLGGLVIPFAAALAYLAATGSLGDLAPLSRQIASYAAGTRFDAVSFCRVAIAAVLLGFPMLVRGAVFRRAPEWVLQCNPRPGPIVPLAILWLLLEFVGVIAQKRMYAYHFLVLAPPAALVYGLLPRRDRLLPIAAALIPAVLLSLVGSALALPYTRAEPALLPASAYLRRHAQPSDAVWQEDMPRLLLETGLSPGSRYATTFLFANSDTAALQYSAGLIDDLARIRPRFVLLPHDLDRYLAWRTADVAELAASPLRRQNYVIAWRRIHDFVQARYHIQAVVAGQDVYAIGRYF